MDSMERFVSIAACAHGDVISNLAQLGRPDTSPRVVVLWMYPDILSLHGGRGDLMALLRFATGAGVPMEIRRVNQLGDPIPFSQGDIVWFCPGDLTAVPHVLETLRPLAGEFSAFAAAGKMICAVGSSGAILGEQLTMGGKTVQGLGLLHMTWVQREKVYGDDLWLTLPGGTEVFGNEIQLADVTLGPGQSPFGQVRYGRGNCGSGFEGAVTGNVIYTGCLGPALVRNPELAIELLRRGLAGAGLEMDIEAPKDVELERRGLEETRRFLEKKMANALKKNKR